MDFWQKLELLGAGIGLVYIWLEYCANRWFWLAGIVMPAVYIYVYLHEGVYANAGINAYFVVAGIWGMVAWKRGSGGEEKRVTRMPGRVWLPAMAVGAALTVVIAWVLIRFTDSPVPWGDAVTTGYSVVGLWMLARKWADQWLVWIVVDAIYFAMYGWMGLWPTAVMYGVFSVVAVFGFFKWKRML